MSGTYEVVVRDQRRMVVPAPIRERTGITEGTDLVMLDTPDGLVLLTPDQRRQRVRADRAGADLVSSPLDDHRRGRNQLTALADVVQCCLSERLEEPMTNKNTICLWFDGDALDAAQFYTATFPDSTMGTIMAAPSDNPSTSEGEVLTVQFTVCGIPCVGLNGGPAFTHSEAFSFQIATDDQAETDRLWNAIVDNGGQESACGWCKDRWGVSWQISPRVLLEAITDPDAGVAKRAFEAMMTMGKIDVAAIEAAIARR